MIERVNLQGLVGNHGDAVWAQEIVVAVRDIDRTCAPNPCS